MAEKQDIEQRISVLLTIEKRNKIDPRPQISHMTNFDYISDFNFAICKLFFIFSAFIKFFVFIHHYQGKLRISQYIFRNHSL